MKPPKCLIHRTDMYLLKGCHRESGGFVDNYWYCGQPVIVERGGIKCESTCAFRVEARNREEAEEETDLQKRISLDSEIVQSIVDNWREFDKKHPKPQPRELRKEPVTEGEMKNICYLDLDKIKKQNENPCFITESTVYPNDDFMMKL